MMRDSSPQRDDQISELLEFIGNAKSRRILVELSEGGSIPERSLNDVVDDSEHRRPGLVRDLLRLGLARRSEQGTIELTDRVRVIQSESSIQFVLIAEDGSSVDVTYPLIEE